MDSPFKEITTKEVLKQVILKWLEVGEGNKKIPIADIKIREITNNLWAIRTKFLKDNIENRDLSDSEIKEQETLYYSILEEVKKRIKQLVGQWEKFLEFDSYLSAKENEDLTLSFCEYFTTLVGLITKTMDEVGARPTFRKALTLKNDLDRTPILKQPIINPKDNAKNNEIDINKNTGERQIHELITNGRFLEQRLR